MTPHRSDIRISVVAIGAFAFSMAVASPLIAAGTQAPASPAMATELFGKKPTLSHPGWDLGAYDPHGDFKDDTGVAIEHIFIPWEDVELGSLNGGDDYARAHNRTLLITIEPWSWNKDWRVTSDQLKRGVLSGQYDPNIDAICKTVGELKSPVMLRWGHEMETHIGRFSWAGWVPKDYIAAYRRFVDHCRPLAPQAKFMWSPKGDANLIDYYPGDNYADVIGLSIFGLQQEDHDKVGRDRTFSELLAPSYDLVARYNKPVMVAELGYVGEDSYKEQWADTVTKIDPRFPLLTSVVYFNDKEVYPWPDPYGLPDWRVVPETTN